MVNRYRGYRFLTSVLCYIGSQNIFLIKSHIHTIYTYHIENWKQNATEISIIPAYHRKFTELKNKKKLPIIIFNDKQ